MGVFDEVKERVTAREVMERAGIVFNRNNMCRCPFHQDKTASMKVKPTDKKYFCFGCGEKGDAIDFVAKYYNRSPREAAMQIADEFGIIYDSSVRSPPKPVRREKSPMQILEETKTKTYRVLSDYLHLLKEWERNFRPESMEKIDERYVEAVQNREKVEFQLDTLLWGTEDEKEAVIHDLGKGVEDIERRVREYSRNQGTVNHNRQRSCEAVHLCIDKTLPKGTILVECGKMLQRGAPKPGKDGKPMKDKHGKVIYEPYRIKVLNTINFKKSMHYNPFAYIHSEKDILKLVTTLIANTKGEGKAGDDFWVKAETLLYCALIGYIHYEAPVEEQNFSTLIEFINAMEVREDDEEFKNPVDLMFDALESEKPNHFAVRQYKKYKLAAGDICSK